MNDERASQCEIYRRGFESYQRRRGMADSTLKTYGYFLDAFSSWLGGRHPRELRKLGDVEAWFDQWESDYVARYNKRPSQNTTRNHQIALHSFYDFLFKRDYVDANPISKLDRTPAGQPKRGDWLSADEFNALLDEPASPQERIIIAVYAWTAARAADIADGVSQGDVDLTPRANFPDGKLTIRKSKTITGERVIPILPELRIELDRWFDHLKGRGLRDDKLPLLVTKNKTRMNHSYTWRVVKRVAGRAGVRRRKAPDKAGENVSTVTLHTLRRTLATHLLNGLNGRDPVRLEVVQALCGHADSRTTLAYYSEVQQETLAAEILRAVR